MPIEISNVGVLAAVSAGAISFLSPCVLPLVPGYVSFIAGNAEYARQTRPARMFAALLSICFVAGFSTIFVLLGASATAMSQVLRLYSFEAGIVGGAVIIVFGVFTTGLVRLPWLDRDIRYHGRIAGGGPLGAYLLGVAFAFGWTPCIGPVLGAILTVSAVSATATNGIVLLSLYSIGLGVPFVFSAIFTRTLIDNLPHMRKAGRTIQLASGIVMILMGVMMMTGQMTRFAFWLLQHFPAFGSIG